MSNEIKNLVCACSMEGSQSFHLRTFLMLQMSLNSQGVCLMLDLKQQRQHFVFGFTNLVHTLPKLLSAPSGIAYPLSLTFQKMKAHAVMDKHSHHSNSQTTHYHFAIALLSLSSTSMMILNPIS